MKRYIGIALAAVALAGGLAACKANNGAAAGPAASAKPEDTVFAVNVMEVTAGAMRDYLRVNADVRNTSTFDVVPDTNGKLTRLSVALGDQVAPGQVVAEVDPSRPGMEFQASQVKTPIGGTVVAVISNLGATVSPAVPIIRVSRMGETRLVSAISERYVAEMRVGLPAEVTLEAFPGRSFPAHVVETAPVLDPVSRTLEIKMQLDQPDYRIKVGMFAMVKLVTATKAGALRLPADAVVQRFGVPFVFVVNGDRVEKRQVITGLQVDGIFEIVQGLKAGDKVVVRGQTLLEDGSRIRVVDTVKLDDAAKREE